MSDAPIKTVFITRRGYGKPYGELRPRVIEPRETIRWDGPIGDTWMVEIGADGAPKGSLDAAAPYIPDVLKKARGRASAAKLARERQLEVQEETDIADAEALAQAKAKAAKA